MQMQTETAVLIPTHQLASSSFQPHRVSARGNLDELAASMREVGVLEPLLVRVHPTADEVYELVAGHRRARAAEIAGLDAVPCIVRPYSDDQVLEVMAVENGQRADLHPLDEAEVFAQLVARGRTVAEVADKVGRSPAYVAQRLKLSDLCPEARQALDDERLSVGAAIALARVPKKLQPKAVAEVLDWQQLGDDPGATASAASVRRHIEENFVLRLDQAPFALDDAALVKKAGACQACPKRTGNQLELYADASSPDLCTDPACYRVKLDVSFSVLARSAVDVGHTVLEGKEAEKALRSQYDPKGYTSMDAGVYIDGKSVEARKLLTKAKVEVGVVLCQDPETGQHLRLVKNTELAKAKAVVESKRKLAPGSAHADEQGDWQAKAKAQRAAEAKKEALHDRVCELAIDQAVRAAEQSPDHEGLTAIIASGMIAGELYLPVLRAALSRRGIELDGATAEEPTLLDAVSDMTPGQLRGLCVELALQKLAPKSPEATKDASGWRNACRALGVSLDLLTGEAKAEAKAAAKAKPAKKGKAKR